MASNNKDVLLLRTTSNDKNNSGGIGEAYYGYQSSPNNNKVTKEVTASKSPSSSQPQITNTDCEAAVEETKTPTHNKQSGLDELLQRAAIAATVSYDDNGTAVPSNIYIDTDSNESEILGKEEATFYSARENEYGDDNLWGLLSGVGGNIYEWYVYFFYQKYYPYALATFLRHSAFRRFLGTTLGFPSLRFPPKILGISPLITFLILIISCVQERLFVFHRWQNLKLLI